MALASLEEYVLVRESGTPRPGIEKSLNVCQKTPVAQFTGKFVEQFTDFSLGSPGPPCRPAVSGDRSVNPSDPEVFEQLFPDAVEVQLIEYLRPEAKFDSLEALKAQMDEDAAKARAALA